MDLALIWAVMKWPFAACLVLPPLLVYLGLHVVKREVIFVDVLPRTHLGKVDRGKLRRG